MDNWSRYQQCVSERETVENVKAALRSVIDINFQRIDLSRNVASVLFVLQALQRHFLHMLELEEDGGYMLAVKEHKPNLHGKAGVLQEEHEEFRRSFQGISPVAETLSHDDYQKFSWLCSQLRELIDRIDLHEQKEADLLHEAFCADEGGEG